MQNHGFGPRTFGGSDRRLILACLLAVAITACAHPDSDHLDADLVILVENAPVHLDPRVATDQTAGRIFELVLNGLVSKNPRGEIIPALAESWEILDDAKRYRFHLRSGVRFHDDHVLTSADVVWSFNSMLDGAVASPKRGAFPQLERVEAIDDLTVDFVLSEPYGALLPNLDSFLGIVPNGTLPEEFNLRPVGTGPYQLVRKSPGSISLRAFDAHWAGKPRLERLLVRAVPDATVRALELRKGSAHLVVNGLPPDVVMMFRNRGGFRVVESPGSNYSYLGINLDHPVLGIRHVRQAIALGIDRDLLIESLWRGLATKTETLLRPGHWAHHDGLEPLPYDPARARGLLDEAGLEDPDGDGPEPRATLVYKTSTDQTALLQAQIIQSMLSKIGLDIEIRSYEFATFYNDIKNGNFELFSLTWTGISDPDIYNLILHSDRIPPKGSNRGRYRNPDFDVVVEEGGRQPTPEARRPYYLQAQEMMARDLPYVSLFIKANAAVMPEELGGYENYPSGEFYGIKNVYWRAPS